MQVKISKHKYYNKIHNYIKVLTNDITQFGHKNKYKYCHSMCAL